MNTKRILLCGGIASAAAGAWVTAELLRLSATPPEAMRHAGESGPAYRVLAAVRSGAAGKLPGAPEQGVLPADSPSPGNTPRLQPWGNSFSAGGVDTAGSGKPETFAGRQTPLQERSALRLRPVTPPPAVPVVFQEIPGLPLSTGQVAAAAAVQDTFIAESGSGTRDPATPDYLRRWRYTQSVADQRLRAAIGGQAFARWQMEAYIKAQQESAAGPGESRGQ